MIKIEMNKGRVVNFFIAGDITEISADFALAFELVYSSFLKQNKTVAEVFKECFLSTIPTSTELAEQDVKDGTVPLHAVSGDTLDKAMEEFKKFIYKQAEGLDE